MFIIYNLLLILSLLFLIPFYGFKIAVRGKYRKSIGPKLGIVPRGTFDKMKGSPRIWVHAVSVGEVTAAAPILKALRERLPNACIILSTSTETGQEMAQKIASGVTAFLYFPLDFPFVIKKMLKNTRPDVFVAVETEIWPNFIRIAKTCGTDILLVNGRISPRSFKGYSRTKIFWKRVLEMITKIGTISNIDAQRLEWIGVPPMKMEIMGNAKFDGLAARVNVQLKEEISAKLQIPEGSHVLVAGSTHEGEEKIMLEVYTKLLKSHPDFLFILIPRHIERGESVTQMVVDAGFPDCIRMSEILAGKSRTFERVIIIDVIGELFKVYSLATFVFCGGSLVPRGGQNILEPAAWGKIVFYGPFMDDFQNEKALLEEAGSGIPIRNGEELLAEIMNLLDHSQLQFKKGEAGREAVAMNKGASERYADMIVKTLAGKANNSIQ
jgi:3-deoxy-D-manno-octulosonic-acid transferase